MTQSEFEAVRWFRKAAAQGHPEAHFCLSVHSCFGDGCSQSLSDAREYAEKALSLDASLTDDFKFVFLNIAREYIRMETDAANEDAIAILTPLTKHGDLEAHFLLGIAHYQACRYAEAEESLLPAALQGDLSAACCALECCHLLERPAEKRAWLLFITRQKGAAAVLSKEFAGKKIPFSPDDARESLRKLRNECGGCGIVLDGKMRKFCGGCLTYCYCHRECQKRHWNIGGHGIECKKAGALNEKMREAAGAKSSGE